MDCMKAGKSGSDQVHKQLEDLQAEFADLQLMYENTMEHGSSLENELVEQNRRMELLQNSLRRYLSPQLYSALVGGTTLADTRSHARKRLTMYFSDIVGFADLTDSIEPEILSDILNSYLTCMSEIALKHSGTIDKFIGDAMLVFFGDPDFVDDATHARRAVAMALEMREELHRLREVWRHQGINRTLQVRAGVNTGYCTVGNFGSMQRMDYTVVGGQVNLAARLQSAAQPDTIYISESTFALVEGQFNFRRIGPMSLKGIHTPVEVWEVLSQKDLTLEGSDNSNGPSLSIEQGKITLGKIKLDLSTAKPDEISALKRALSKVLVELSLYEASLFKAL